MVQELFDSLIETYNLRAITIEGETWYSINDLEVREPRKTFSDLKKNGMSDFIENNTILLKKKNVLSTDIRNFDDIANRGELFGNFKMVNYLIMNSRLGSEYKIELIEILDKIRTEGYYIDNNISQEQLDNLQCEVDRLQRQLSEERVKKVYGATEIVKHINVDNLLSSSLFRYMDEVANVGSYKVRNKNRIFKYDQEFVDRCCAKGIARVGVGGRLEFYIEFANRINSCSEALKCLRRINDEEIQIRQSGIDKRSPF